MDKKAMASILRGIEGTKKWLTIRAGGGGAINCKSDQVSFDEATGLVTIRELDDDQVSFEFISCAAVFYVRVEHIVEKPVDVAPVSPSPNTKKMHSLDKRSDEQRRNDAEHVRARIDRQLRRS